MSPTRLPRPAPCGPARRRRGAAATLALALGACEPALDQRLDRITAPRILAVVAAPAEARPGEAVSLSALVVDPAGPRADVPAWAMCTAPTPSTEPNAVADGCFADQATPLGAAPTLTATLPADACLTYGPATKPGGFRPRDPDGTGGYYQPVRVTVDLAATDGEGAPALVALGAPRITCDLALAPADVARAYRQRYVANAAPVVAGLEVSAAGAPLDPAAVPADETVTVTARWPEGTAEPYLWYDLATGGLVTRQEALRASFFTTAGELSADAVAVAEGEARTEATLAWRTPARPGPAWLWVVLRDSRGGLATATLAVTLR